MAIDQVARVDSDLLREVYGQKEIMLCHYKVKNKNKRI